MGFALYYEAKRKEPLTEQEETISKEISEKYCSEYPFKRKVEDFGIYNDLKDQNDIIFSGSTKLPGNGPKTLFEVANYWLKCLTEITHLLTNATWNVTFDDVDLIFDLDEGWRFPTDEEYKKQKSN
ncbi:hypothetical protein [Lacrimispora sp. 210928-DFI.3.58]|uniref:hypothetical protein n=1 Tax=Lacrimispora sp. 210928-DFI.3.58 TaxID=2883214 RepID=UPI001D0778D3|nr:hypothetical protein [Lacrimispora sp. 210928-DFI.3.58]MCB7321011.1 hypothetical protein [Lacrimispora sp. 210928-DFI.3.58]